MGSGDSTSCRAHQHAAGARKKQPRVPKKDGQELPDRGHDARQEGLRLPRHHHRRVDPAPAPHMIRRAHPGAVFHFEWAGGVGRQLVGVWAGGGRRHRQVCGVWPMRCAASAWPNSPGRPPVCSRTVRSGPDGPVAHRGHGRSGCVEESAVGRPSRPARSGRPARSCWGPPGAGTASCDPVKVTEPTRVPSASTCRSFRSGATIHQRLARPTSPAGGRTRHNPVVRRVRVPGGCFPPQPARPAADRGS